MKVIVWVLKSEIICGDIKSASSHCPQPGYGNYIQVNMSIDEYVKINDIDSVTKSFSEHISDEEIGEIIRREDYKKNIL